MTQATFYEFIESTTNTQAMNELNNNFDAVNAQLPSNVDWDIISENGTQTLENKTLTSPTIDGGTITGPTIISPTITLPTVSSGTFTNSTFVNPALGTPASGVATNLTGIAASLTSGITNGLKSATTTVNVSSATAPSANQVLVATSSTTATWQTYSPGYWDFAIKLGSDFTVTNNATLTDVTWFTFASVTGEVWHIEIMGSCTASDATGDIKAELVTTGTWANSNSILTGQYFNASAALTALSLTTTWASTTTALGSLIINNGDNTVRPFYFEYRTVITTGWNIKFQIANSAAAGGRTSTIKAGTYMRARKLST
jgi:hypothetical protein